MDFIRRLLGLGPSSSDSLDPLLGAGGRLAGVSDRTMAEVAPADGHPSAEEGRAGEPDGAASSRPDAAAAAGCPSCGTLLDPAPTRNRRCPNCRQPIVVRRHEGRLVLLTEAAVAVFDAERQRERDEIARNDARGRWLTLAATVRASRTRRQRLAAAAPSAEVVAASRSLYLRAAERAAREARHGQRWAEVARIRRAQAAALYADTGSPVPPPDEIVALHREGMDAVLRSLAPMAPDAELVAARCCPACAEDDGTIVRIAAELRASRLPHAGCPKGLCGCDWWIAEAERRSRRRRARAAGGAVAAPPTSEAPPSPMEP